MSKADKLILQLNNKEALKELVEDPNTRLEIKKLILKDAYNRTKAEVYQTEIEPGLAEFLKHEIAKELPFNKSLKKMGTGWYAKSKEVLHISEDLKAVVSKEVKSTVDKMMSGGEMGNMARDLVKKHIYSAISNIAYDLVRAKADDLLKNEMKGVLDKAVEERIKDVLLSTTPS